jgi:hypothetical protein
MPLARTIDDPLRCDPVTSEPVFLFTALLETSRSSRRFCRSLGPSRSN